MALQKLTSLLKKIVVVEGKDTVPLLQGLLTNDVTSTAPVIYSYLLNSQGRLMFDLFVYKLGEDKVLLEVDSALESSLIKALNVYKLRKHVSISSTSLRAVVSQINLSDSIISQWDPRLKELGIKSVIEESSSHEVTTDDVGYRRLRYKLGVCEGFSELGIGRTIPLESNGDFLEAISFSKGCYIGQELTARSFHTGVVRKRIMPIKFLKESGEPPVSLEAKISDEGNRKIGIVRGEVEELGVALMRVKEALEATQLSVPGEHGAVALEVNLPTWWPRSIDPKL